MRSSPGTEPESELERADLPDELRAQLDDARRQLVESENRHLRARADLENYRKRSERELERRVQQQADDLLRAWLEAVDSVERALALEAADAHAAEGFAAFLDQMEAILARQGVRRIGEVGDRFDPELHEAVAAMPDADRPPGTIAGVARSGYAIGDRVLRPAEVAVARAPGDGG